MDSSNKTLIKREPGTDTPKGKKIKNNQKPKDTTLKPEQAGSFIEIEVKAEPRDDELNIFKNENIRDDWLPGSSPVTVEIPSQRNPGSLQQDTRDVPLSSNILEREAMDVSEKELMETAPWHINQWVKDLEGQGLPKPVMATITANDVRKNAVEQSVADVTNDDDSPSTSVTNSKRTPKRVSKDQIFDGSDLDSDFDDEFDTSGIPDSEYLEDPIREVITNIETAMDDVTDRLLGTSSDFTWVEGFETFKGAPERFSGPTPGPCRDYDSPYEAFTDIWDREIMDKIALETNRYARQTMDTLVSRGNIKPGSRIRGWTETNADEIMVFLVVLMYMSLDPRTSINEYWKTDNCIEMTKFKRLMPYNRYILLNKCLHFVDNFQQNGDVESAMLAPKLLKLSPIIEHLQKKFDSLYNLERNISIDESLTLFKEMSWVQKIRSNVRFGIKSYELCESRTGYMARFQIYAGPRSSDPSDLGGSTKIVLELLQGLENRGHCVTMDNFYNSPSLARYLKSLGFDCLGTLRLNRRNVPKDITELSKNLPKNTIVSRQCGDVSIMAWKDSKLVSFISTYHNDGTIKSDKPLCVRDYSNTMVGVDLKDQKLSMHLLERKRGMKWYIKMFKRLLNISIHNAFIMYVNSLERRNKLALTHREFRFELAKSMVERHRIHVPEITEPVGELMRLRRDVVHVPKYSFGRDNRKRCVVCQREKIDKKVNSECITCNVHVCFENCWEKWHSLTELGDQRRRRGKRKRNE